MEEYYVYMHLDPLSKETRYIGKGKGNRAYDFVNRYGYHKNWIKSLSNKGLEPEVDFVTKNLTDKNAKLLEKSEIKKAKELGLRLTNGTIGGEGGNTSLNLEKHPRSKVVICINDGREFKDAHSASSYYQIDVKNIRRSCKSIHSIAEKGLKFIFKREPKKSKTKNYVRKRVIDSDGNIYKNATEAVRLLEIEYSHFNNHLRGLSGQQAVVVNGKLRTFWLEGENPKPIPDLFDWRGKKKILCLNNNKIYESARAAAKDLNICYKHISTVCRGKRPHTYGYIFEYYIN